jgi:uncharacterized membrane protein YobD (UPF0266 family)
MSLPAFLGFTIILLLICIYTISFAVWNWKNGNKTGAVMVFLLCAATAVLPVYIAFFRS